MIDEVKNMSSNEDVWILAEQTKGQMEEVSLELVCEGRKIADELEEELCVVVIGSSITGMVDSLDGYGVDKIYLLDSPIFADYSAELYTAALSNFVSEQHPRILLCAATPTGNELATMLAACLKTGLVSDCISLDLSEDGLLLHTKPIYGGKAYGIITCPSARPQMATIRPGTMAVKRLPHSKRAEVISITSQLEQKKPRITRESFIKADPKTINIDEAEIIVACGRGVGNSENIRILEELADILGGSVAASQKSVDEGWIDRKRLVGQTGLTISPKLYIACGISGAPHHVLGMKDSRVIIAINTDRYAPIFKVADIGIVGDVLEIVPAITRQLRELSKEAVQKDNRGKGDGEV